MGGKNYAVTFIDDHSRKTWVYLLAAKSDVLGALIRFQELVENETGLRLKVLRSDNGGEYTGNKFLAYLAAKGICAQTTTPHTPQQNGRAERMNRTLMESARSMLHARDLPRSLWGEALTTAAYIRNRCPADALGGRTPEEAWTGSVPDISNMRVFGCKAYVHVPNERRNKLDAKAVMCRFIGYCEGTKGWRFYEASGRRLIKSRDAVFLEEDDTKRLDSDGTKPGTSRSTHLLDTTRCTGALQTKALEPCRTTLLPQSGPLNSPNDGQYMARLGIDPAPSAWQATPQTTGPPVLHESLDFDANINPSDEILPGKKCTPNKTEGTKNVERDSEKRSRQVPYVLISPRRTREERALAAMDDEPATMREAKSRGDAALWCNAAKKELESIAANDTWDLVELPSGRRAIDSKWVFKIKRDAAGNVERYKARLVARGFMQEQGVDFSETFAPVAKFASIRVLLAIAAAEDLELHQLDVDTAFLNGDLKEEIYMKQPVGFEEPGRENLVCRLKKYCTA